ncbi:T-cell receptor alpha chain V region RL-5 [Anabarilius grahami]|nr:T-cell receptor alpha chain V region RL-5 [Anabarilius grahami]
MEERQMLLMMLVTVSGGFADKIGPKDGNTNVIKEEGESVTLSCTYETNSNDIWLYWYRQYPNREPEYLLYKGARSQSSEEDIPAGFRSSTSQSSTELIINSVTLSDSALYYCALWSPVIQSA